MEAAFFLEPSKPALISEIEPFHVEGSLIIHQGIVGTLNNIETDTKKALFLPLTSQDDFARYELYILLRDNYLEITHNSSRIKLPMNKEEF